MEAEKVDFFIMCNAKYFDAQYLHQIRNRLLELDENKWFMLQSMQFKDPTTSLIISILGGGFGIDRFYIGDTGLGVGKLLTCGGAGIWAIVDLFFIMDATRNKNLELLQRVLMY
jgi:TM2 domain.